MITALLPAIAIAAVAAWFGYRRLAREHAETLRIRSLFSRYVPEQVVDDLLARKDPRLFEARQYYATILTCRIRNFALFTEHLSPQATLRYLNEFYTLAGGAVQRNRGMIESLRGGTVTAVFGVLVEEAFQEERALRAALDIVRLASAMDARWRAQGRKPLGVCVGVNSGTVVAGDTGFQLRRDFAIVGHPAHVAARLAHVAEEINAAIVASEQTFNAVRELFVGIPISALPLRGLRRLQRGFIVRGLTKRVSEDDLLALPSERYFKRTNVTVPPAAPGQDADEYVAPSALPEPRIRAYASLHRTHFSRLDDDRPAMPDPPALPP